MYPGAARRIREARESERASAYERRVYTVCVFLAATLDSYVSPEASRSSVCFMTFFLPLGLAFPLNLDRARTWRGIRHKGFIYLASLSFCVSAYLSIYIPIFYLYADFISSFHVLFYIFCGLCCVADSSCLSVSVFFFSFITPSPRHEWK